MKHKRQSVRDESWEEPLERYRVPEIGEPGASAEREYERRRASRRTRVRERYGLVGSVVDGLRGEPGHQFAWRQGAAGEIATANAFRIHLQRTDVVILHDRRIPIRGGRWNIDHLTVGPGGVTVIDSNSSRGTVQLTTVGIVNKREVLLVNGRDRTSQLDAVERQIDRVVAALRRGGFDDVAVTGALCFPFMHRPWLHFPYGRDGLVRVDDPRHIVKLANRPGPHSAEAIDAVSEFLERAFPEA